MAILIPPKVSGPASTPVLKMFGLLKKLSDEFVVRHLLNAGGGPQFLVIWRERHAFLLRAVATTQELADNALSPSFFTDERVLKIDEVEDAAAFTPLVAGMPVRCLVVFPNVDAHTIDQIERLRSEESGVSFLGLRQTAEGRLASYLEALAEAPLSEPMLLELRSRFDAGTRIHLSSATLRQPLLQRGNAALPPAFLDLSQEMLAKVDVALPEETEREALRPETRLVTGPAGCGKSLVLVHRALFAARLNQSSRLLVLSHNGPILRELERRVHASAPEGAAIECLTFFQWSKRVMNWREDALHENQKLRLVASLTTPDAHPLKPEFITEEIGYLRDLGISSLPEYLALERTGRVSALTSARRRAVWNIMENYRECLHSTGNTDWHEVALRFREFARDHPQRMPAYDFIFIDEAQFFARVWFEPVLAALKPGGQLFLAADPTQGFLKRRNSWLAAGIEVRGRSSRLAVPYRSTRAILRFARDLIQRRAALHPDSTDDFDPPTDDDFATIPEEGEPPTVLAGYSAQDAIARVKEKIAELQEKFQHLAGQVLVLHADSSATKNVLTTLRAGLGDEAVADLNGRTPQPPHQFCSISNLKAATGLEAAVVFLLGVDGLLEKEADPRLDDDSRAELSATHTRLLYMACTRAARRLVIFSDRWS